MTENDREENERYFNTGNIITIDKRDFVIVKYNSDNASLEVTDDVDNYSSTITYDIRNVNNYEVHEPFGDMSNNTDVKLWLLRYIVALSNVDATLSDIMRYIAIRYRGDFNTIKKALSILQQFVIKPVK